MNECDLLSSPPPTLATPPQDSPRPCLRITYRHSLLHFSSSPPAPRFLGLCLTPLPLLFPPTSFGKVLPTVLFPLLVSGLVSTRQQSPGILLPPPPRILGLSIGTGSPVGAPIWGWGLPSEPLLPDSSLSCPWLSLSVSVYVAVGGGRDRSRE